ncbi:MAG TPA: hypothetical protein VK095_05895 [Beutenbergiaceae bacterium]|nr:hypothetical protein [Beutenbergiaceae bacterium]
MAAESAITKPDLKEVVASVVACVAALAVTLSNNMLRPDQAMVFAAAVPTVAWTAFNTHAFRHWFAPKPDHAEQASKESPHHDPHEEDLPEEAKEGWGIFHHWLLGLVTPVIIVIVLSFGYELNELAGPGARIPEPILLMLLFAVAPWLVGLVAWLGLVVPGGLIASGLRPGMSSRGSRIFGGIWAYLGVAFAVAAAQGAPAPTYGRPGSMADGLATLFGLNEESITSPGWLWAARVLFAVTLVVMPILGVALMQLSKRKNRPTEMDSDPENPTEFSSDS